MRAPAQSAESIYGCSAAAAVAPSVSRWATCALRFNPYGLWPTPVLEQAWQGSDGSVLWMPVPFVDKPPA